MPLPIVSFPFVKFFGDDIEKVVKNGELQAKVVKKAADTLPTDCVMTMMDLSVEAEAFGAKVKFSPDRIPAVEGILISSPEDAEKLSVPVVGDGRTSEFLKTVRLLRSEVKEQPVFAGIIGPFSLAARLMDMTEIMILCFEEPEAVLLVLEKVTRFLSAYARELKKAGADGLLIAEPAAGLLSPALMDEFSTPFVNSLIEAVNDDDFTVIYHNCGNVVPLTQSVKKVEADAFSFGNVIDLEKMLLSLPADKLVMGNIDPVAVITKATPAEVREKTAELIARCAGYPNFVPASGCDIPPSAPIENLVAFVGAAES